MAHAGNAGIGEQSEARRPIVDHDVHRQGRGPGEAGNHGLVGETGSEQPVGAGIGVGVSALERRREHRLVVPFRRLLEEDIGPRIDEVAKPGRIGCQARLADALDLLGDVAQLPALGETVLEVASDRAGFDGARNRALHRVRRLPVAALDVDGHRQGRRARDPREIVDGEVERYVLAIPEAVGGCDGPASRGKRARP